MDNRYENKAITSAEYEDKVARDPRAPDKVARDPSSLDPSHPDYKPPRDEHGRLLPGAKLNPSGLSYDKKEIIQLCRDLSVEAVERIAEIMRTSTNDATVICAANSLIDRGYGKPGIRKDENELGMPEVDMDGIRDRFNQIIENKVSEVLRSGNTIN